MKTIILTLALTVIATLGFAQFPQSTSPDSCCYVADDLRVAIFQDNDSFINVKIAKIPGDLIKIRVSENNKVLYQRRVKKHAITDLQYDINQFPIGTYSFEIIKDNEVVYTKMIEQTEPVENLVQR